MRLFLGIPLASAAINELSAITERLRSSATGLRWSSPESWHITLQFLGNTTPERCECVTTRLRDLRSSPVPIALESIDSFDRAGILHLGVRLTPALLSLHQQVVATTGLCGFIPETRPYHSHITLARSKGKSGGQQLHQLITKIRRQPRFTSFVADTLLLYESFPGPTGSRYEIRERFPLISNPSGAKDAV